MGVLSDVREPAQLSGLDEAQLKCLAAEIREFLISSVCRTGGHLGPNLGVVELTIALHRVFDSPHTPIVFDTGHQAYVHKLLTGRAEGFARLRQQGGLSGYPSRAESEHDLVENSHASTALAYADGLSKGRQLLGEQRPVVAVIGDGALTGGLAWEALNNLGTAGRPVVVVLNDNGRSYSPTIGGLSHHLRRLRDRPGYDSLVDLLGGTSSDVPPVLASSVFDELGFGYLGPLDGHDIAALEAALTHAAGLRRPVVVHVLTEKGRGYRPAELDQADHMHTVGVIDPATGTAPRPLSQQSQPVASPKRSWTDVFADTLVELAGDRPDLVGVSAAMLGPTGLQRLLDRYPERCFDVGIAEQQAVTSAAGLAMSGAHPVVAIYATFANRAFDQILMDVALHRLPVTFVLDRAGITGPDGASHHGIWDLSMLGTVPGMRVAAPRDSQTLSDELREAVAHTGGPTAIRFPKGTAGPAVPALRRIGGLDVLAEPVDPDPDRPTDVLLVAVGARGTAAVEAAGRLAAAGVGCTVVDPRWVLPVDRGLGPLASAHSHVVTVEEGVLAGGVGSRVAQLLAETGVRTPVTELGLPNDFAPHASRAELLARYGLDASGVADRVLAALDDHTAVPAPLLDEITTLRVRTG